MASQPKGKRRAVVIGINSYRDEKLQTLAGAVNDATELRDILRERGEFEFDDRGDDFLVDADATGERIRRAISNLLWKTDECEIALIYFAGHGRRDHLKNGFLLPHDVDYDEPFVRGIQIEELRRLFLLAQPKATGILILDCCYSGIAVGAERGEPDTEAIDGLHETLDLKNEGSGRYILVSADADKTAREEAREHSVTKIKHAHGSFSFDLIEALQGAAADRTGRVSLGGLIEHLGGKRSGTRYRPHFASGANMHGVFLAWSSAQRQAYIEKHLSKVRDLLAEGKPRNLVQAVKVVDGLQREKIWCEEADGFVREIDDRAAQLRDVVSSWWIENSLNLQLGVSDTAAFRALRAIARQFSYATLINLETRDLTLVLECVEDIMDGKSVEEIGQYMLDREVDRAKKIGATDATKPTPTAQSVSVSPPIPVSRSLLGASTSGQSG